VENRWSREKKGKLQQDGRIYAELSLADVAFGLSIQKVEKTIQEQRPNKIG